MGTHHPTGHPPPHQAPLSPPGTHHPVSPQGNLVAVKHLNRKRIELTRKVLFELKHVGGPRLGAAWWDGGAQPGVPLGGVGHGGSPVSHPAPP